jgi:hypothetical protein
MGKNDFPRYTRRGDQREALAAYVCEWRMTSLGVHPNELRTGTRRWTDAGIRGSGRKSQRHYWQTAVIYPDTTAAHKGMATLQKRCAKPSTDTRRVVNGWTHIRRVQNIPCIARGRCGKVTDILNKGNLVIATNYAEVHNGRTGKRTTLARADRLTSRILGNAERLSP